MAAVGAQTDRPLSAGGSRRKQDAVCMTHLTAVHQAIMRIVLMYDGQYGPYAIAAALRELSNVSEDQWSPILDKLDELEDAGMIRQQAVEVGAWRYLLTERGRKMLERH
ncbi:MAG TPA: hypothetical protein VKB78_16825 [Pirellulales bacterium]|nr:hypothetical protein [Pirellulales bacterium]